MECRIEIPRELRVTGRQIMCGVCFFIVGFFPEIAGSETYVMDSYYPSPAGVYNNVTVLSDSVLARDRGNVGVGTQSPQARAPNRKAGNIDANDVYLRSVGKWGSELGGVTKVCNCGGWTGSYGWWEIVPGRETWTAQTCLKVCQEACGAWYLHVAMGCISDSGLSVGTPVIHKVPTVKPRPNCGW